MAIKRMCLQCVPGALSSPSSVPGNEATELQDWHVSVLEWEPENETKMSLNRRLWRRGD